MIEHLVLTPLIALAVTLPLGTALVTAAHGGAPGRRALLLAVPIGLCAWILVLEASRVVLGGTPWWPTAVLAVAGLAALVAVRGLPALRGHAGDAATFLALYGVVTAPIWAQAGRSVVLGFNRNNDSVFATVLAQLIADGRPAVPPAGVTGEYLWYPLGSMDLVAGVAGVLGTGAFETTMPVLAVVVASLLWCALAIVDRIGAPRSPWLPAGAAIVTLGALQVSYYAQGTLPSMTMLVPLLATLVLAWDAGREGRPAVGALAGLCAGATITVYGLSTLGWIAPFAALAVAVTVAERGVAAIRPIVVAGLAAAAAGVLAVPGVVRAWRFQGEVADDIEGGLVLGNLGAALDPLLALGVDRTLAPVLTLPAFAIAGLLFVAGLAWALSRGRHLATLLLAACGFTAIYATLAGPYYVAKALSPASVVVVSLAVVGASQLWRAGVGRRSWRGAVAVACVVWAAGAGWTAAHYLRESARTPAWLADLEDMRGEIGARGPAVVVTPRAQTWIAWALRGAEFRVTALEGAGAEATPELLQGARTVVVEEGGTAPGEPWRLAETIGGAQIYVR